MFTENSRRHSGCAGLRLCATLMILILLSAAAARPAYAVGGAFFDDLTFYDTTLWSKSNGWTNGDPFNVGWRDDHIYYNAFGNMVLQLDDIPCPAGCSARPYASGEYQSIDTYGYGKFATRMKAASGDGLVTSFFTYTGTAGGPDHDEIDIEILGKDTWSMQINYFVAGVGGHEVTIPLGFDASAGYHNYGFMWTANEIKWYVDGVLVHTETANPAIGKLLPSLPGKIMANLWAGTGVDAWLNPFVYPGTPIHAKYDWIRYLP